jgi:hypothetical protein
MQASEYETCIIFLYMNLVHLFLLGTSLLSDSMRFSSLSIPTCLTGIVSIVMVLMLLMYVCTYICRFLTSPLV